jgi:hypothetical protein
MTNKDPIEKRVAYMIQDFIRANCSGADFVEAIFINMVAATLAGRNTAWVDPLDIDFNLTVLIEDAVENFGDGSVAAPMAVEELVRQIRTLEIVDGA